MDDLAKTLEGLLENPDISSKLKSVIGGEQTADAELMKKVTKAVTASDDRRTRLLQDLKPYISNERRKRVDEAVQILRIISVLDIFKE